MDLLKLNVFGYLQRINKTVNPAGPFYKSFFGGT